MATMTACPFCFRKIDSSRLAYQCSGRGQHGVREGRRTRPGSS